ncbi:MAG: 4Fe-4S binding protein [Desulfobacteraceae bacterium]|nr:4Fe-4S binding protein [Desulfobacteraceae bacterium]MBC2757263.1 4Fe-4S binding protein [Desulfobacteraceae bacterium]
MANPYWIKYLINKTFYQRFFWAKLTNYPVIGRIIDYALFNDDDIFYLPKDKTIPINEAVDQPEGMVAPSQIVEHFIRQANYHWIMDSCICRESTHCKDYPIDLGCIFLGEAVKEINPKFGRIVTAEEALIHAQKCREAGLVHMVGKNKLDSVWLNAGPSEKLMTICNCCPCCCLWKILPVISPEISAKINRLPGLTVTVTDQCIGCGMCTEDICFVNAITLENEQAVIDQDSCRGCGRCVSICPNEAIEITVEDPAYIRRSIKRLENVVDVT